MFHLGTVTVKSRRAHGVSSSDPVRGALHRLHIAGYLVWVLILGTAVRSAPALAKDPAPGSADDPREHIRSLWRDGLVDSFYVVIDKEIEAARDHRPGHEAPHRGHAPESDREELLRELLAMRGQALARQGRAAEAEPDLREAIHLAQEQGADAAERSSLRWLGFVLQRLDRSDESRESWQRLLLLSRRDGDSTHQAWAMAGLAYLDWNTEQSSIAEDEYRRAIELFRDAGDLRGEAHAWNGLGTAQQAQGRYEDALASYERAASMADSLHWTWLAGLASNNVGTLLYYFGDPGEARARFQQACELQIQSGDMAEAALAGCNVARCDADLRRYDEATADLERIQQGCRERGIAEFDAMFRNSLAGIRHAQGRPRLGAALYRETLAGGAAVPPKHRVEALLGLSEILMESDSVTAAIVLLREAVPWVGRVTDATMRLDFDIELGKSLLAAGQSQEALSLLEGARWTAARLNLRQPELRASSLAAWAAQETGEIQKALDLTRAAVECWQRERGLPADPEWREVRSASIQGIVTLRAELLLDLPEDRPAVDRVRAAFDSLQVFKARTLMERMLGPTAATKTPALASADRLQAGILRPGEILLDFYLGSRRSLVFAVTPLEIRVARLPPEAELKGVLDLYLRALLSNRTDDEFVADRSSTLDPSSTGRIERMILGPVMDMVEASRAVIVVPDGVLHRLSFAGLLAEGTNSARTESKILTTVPSAAVFETLRLNSRAFDGPTTILALAGTRGVGGRPLPGAKGEIRDLSDRLRHVSTSIPLHDSGLIGMESFGLLHLAGHAVIDEEHPWRSRIDLDGASESGTDRLGTDTLSLAIPASEIARGRLHARLAVLSACRSAGGSVISGEGVRSLAGSFLAAGVPTVVASLWPVDDRSTRALMRRFYAALAQGQTVAGALHAAQREMRGDRRLGTPRQWAGFVVIGDGSPTIPLEQRPHPIAWPSILILLGATTLLGWGLFRYNCRDPR
jgi:CHAT domain-containing protein/tetratricopeptide (TPR) repeat protein